MPKQIFAPPLSRPPLLLSSQQGPHARSPALLLQPQLRAGEQQLHKRTNPGGQEPAAGGDEVQGALAVGAVVVDHAQLTGADRRQHEL